MMHLMEALKPFIYLNQILHVNFVERTRLYYQLKKVEVISHLPHVVILCHLTFIFLLVDIQTMFTSLEENTNDLNLTSEYRLSAKEYSIIRHSIPHILLDVRSVAQFNMISLPSDEICQHIINVPLKMLEKMSLEEIQSKLFENSCRTEKINVYVICRRGIDSVSAVKFLAEKGFSSSSIKNIDGGLTSWYHDVDLDFPIY